MIAVSVSTALYEPVFFVYGSSTIAEIRVLPLMLSVFEPVATVVVSTAITPVAAVTIMPVPFDGTTALAHSPLDVPNQNTGVFGAAERLERAPPAVVAFVPP